jgi:hypothetical protein
MEHLSTDRTAHDRLRIVFNDQVVFVPLGDRATVGDVADMLRGFGPRHYGHPIAIDVTLRDSPGLPRSPGFWPETFKFEDDPAAEFEYAAPLGAAFVVPYLVAASNA